MRRQPGNLKKSVIGTFNWIMRSMTTLVNIVSYFTMTLGLFRGIYFSLIKPSAIDFIWTVAITVFAIYINLKNPNN